MYWLLSMVGNWYNQAGFGVYLPMRSLFKISVHIRMLIFLLYPYIHMSSVALPFPGFRFASVEFPLQVKLPSPSDAPSQFRNAKKLRQNLWSQKNIVFSKIMMTAVTSNLLLLQRSFMKTWCRCLYVFVQILSLPVVCFLISLCPEIIDRCLVLSHLWIQQNRFQLTYLLIFWVTT